MSRKIRKRMSFLKGIETFTVVKYFVFSAASLWIICESAPNTGRNWEADDDDFVHIYKPDFKLELKPPRFNFEDEPTISRSTAVWIGIGFGIFSIVSMLFACVMACRWVRKHTTRANESEHRTFIRQPPFNEQVSGGNRDVPPSYAAVAERSSVLGSRENPTNYPKIAKGKKMETPPPEYITVAPFQ